MFQMQMYCVSDVHFCQITCVEWSQNTLKLFSGDQDGCVACSEMDYAEVTIFRKTILGLQSWKESQIQTL